MDVTSEYIGYLYLSLVRRGYLKKHGATQYQLTPIGMETVLDFLRKNETMSRDIVRRLKMLGIEISPAQEQKIGKLKMEAVKVS